MVPPDPRSTSVQMNWSGGTRYRCDQHGSVLHFGCCSSDGEQRPCFSRERARNGSHLWKQKPCDQEYSFFRRSIVSASFQPRSSIVPASFQHHSRLLQHRSSIFPASFKHLSSIQHGSSITPASSQHRSSIDPASFWFQHRSSSIVPASFQHHAASSVTVPCCRQQDVGSHTQPSSRLAPSRLA